MCGIVGAYNPGRTVVADDILARMRDTMIHRGPDGGQLWREPRERCVLGHRRLSIIDLSNAASQPMANADGSVVLVFNGEIYNHAQLRRELEATGRHTWRTDHSDTEVLLNAYLEWGLDCVRRFYGMFAVAIYDARDPHRPLLHLIRDRMGVKPLYFARASDGEWLFASEIRAILAHPAMSRQLDRTAFWHYLTFIVAPAPMTLCRDVFKLPAGHRMTIDHLGRATAERWYDLRPSAAGTLKESDISFDEACGQLLNLMRRSVERRMVSDVPFGVLLSGGVDSSLNVALMSELMDRPVTSFSIGYEGFDDYNEFHHARRVAERYGTDHHERRITAQEVMDNLPRLIDRQDEPIADNVCIPLYFLAELVRQNGTTVVQVGEGADEHFLGYWWCDHYRERYETLFDPARRGHFNNSWWRRLLGRSPVQLPGSLTAEDWEFLRRARAGEPMFWGGAACYVGEMRHKLTPDPQPFRQDVNCPVEGLMPDAIPALDSAALVAAEYAKLDRLAEPEILQQIPFLESRMRLPEHLLMRVDKMTMAHSIEARVPFLDHDVVEFATRLPLSYKLDNGLGKRIVKKIAESFVDTDLLYRRKQGFGAPIDLWMTDPKVSRRFLDAFRSSRLAREGLLDNAFFEGMLQDQADGKSNNGFHIWTVLNAVLWHEMTIEGRKAF